MNFGKRKGKKSPDTRGLSDHHSQPTNHVSAPASSSLVSASPNPPIAFPYEPPQQVRDGEPRNVNFFAGGNENEEGEQEVDEVEVGNSSANGVVSPIFASNRGNIDIKIGNNKNKGQNQKIGKVRFGNVE